jgi:hypothetical protein
MDRATGELRPHCWLISRTRILRAGVGAPRRQMTSTFTTRCWEGIGRCDSRRRAVMRKRWNDAENLPGRMAEGQRPPS